MSTESNPKVGGGRRMMPAMTLAEETLAYVSLLLLCGAYQITLIVFPALVYLSYRSSSWYSPWSLLLFWLIFSMLVPIDHKPWMWFLRSPIWRVWHKYFDYQADLSSVEGKLEASGKYLFWEAPHGIWPMGQFLSCPYIPALTGASFEERFISGTAANVVFYFPVVRHIMSWIGTHKASRTNFSKIFKRNNSWAAVVAGGIAEMYLGTSTREGIYVRKRFGTVKMAIQEGANIIPAFFFGNSRCFTVVGAEGGAGGKDVSFMGKLLQRLSRTLKASIVIFYGRHFLPVPYRQPLKMVSGRVIKVKQNDSPSDAEVQAVLNEVVAEFERLYASDQRPAWETRPLKLH